MELKEMIKVMQHKVCHNYKTKKYATKYQTAGGFKWRFKD